MFSRSGGGQYLSHLGEYSRAMNTLLESIEGLTRDEIIRLADELERDVATLRLLAGERDQPQQSLPLPPEHWRN